MTAPLYVFAGGGTGGHLFPGIAVAEQLVEREPEARILFLGTDRPIERDILASTDYEHQPVVSEARGRLWRRVGGMAKAYRTAVRVLRNGKPRAVIGCGGGASVPTVLAARRLGIPVFLLEQNVIPGRATRLLSRLNTTVCLTYAESAILLPTSARFHVTGNPVRRAIAELATDASFPQPTGLRTLLVLGGSQGAHSINEVLLHLAEHHSECLDGWRIVHQTGQQDADRMREEYERLGIEAVVGPFFDDMLSQYRAAELVVSRAGGTTLSELACAGLSAVLVPYPHAKDDHQTANANVYADSGAAVIVQQLSTEEWQRSLANKIARLLTDTEQRQVMSHAMRKRSCPTAAREIVAMI